MNEKSTLREVANDYLTHTSSDNGITLIALVITIIVLLILAGISIMMLTGENGIIAKAQDSKLETKIGEEKEAISIAYNGVKIKNSGNEVTDQELEEGLHNNGYTNTTANGMDKIIVKFTDTGHIYIVDSYGNITLNTLNIEDFNKDPIIDISTSYILRQSGKLSTYTLVNKNRNYEEYDPIESNETVIGENPKEIGDGYYIDSENNLNIYGKEQKINNVKIVDINDEFVLTNDGKLYLWGWNKYGKIGNGTTEYSEELVCINDIPGNKLYGKNITLVGIGDGCFAIDSDGKAYTWGTSNASQGVLGNGTTEVALEPICITDISSSPLYQKKIKDMYIGEWNSWAIDEEGKLYIWGRNYDGNIGDGRHGRNVDSSLPICVSDITNSVLYGKKIKHVSVTFDGSWAIDEDDNLYTWGTSWVVRLGANMTDNDSYNYLPVSVSSVQESPLYNKKVRCAYISDYACYALDRDGKIYTWGDNSQGVAGVGTTDIVYMPVCLNDVENSAIYEKTINEVYSNFLTMYATDEEGKKYGWGEDVSSNVPKLLEDQNKDIIKIVESYRDAEGTEFSFISITQYLDKNGKMFISSKLYEPM